MHIHKGRLMLDLNRDIVQDFQRQSWWVNFCLWSVFWFAVIKNWPKINLGKERVCLLYFHITVCHRGKSEQELGIQRQQLKQRPQSKAAYWLTFPGLLSLLSYAIQSHLPRVASLSVSLVISDQSPIKKCPTNMPTNQSHGCNPLGKISSF